MFCFICLEGFFSFVWALFFFCLFVCWGLVGFSFRVFLMLVLVGFLVFGVLSVCFCWGFYWFVGFSLFLLPSGIPGNLTKVLLLIQSS